MNILVCGYGKAGSALINVILNSNKHNLVGIICRNESLNAGKDIGEILYPDSNIKKEILITKISDAEKIFIDKKIDVVIDFSNRVMTLSLLELCVKIHSNLIVCTTNHSVEEIQKFEQIANSNKIGVVYAPNLTIGINLLMEFAKKISKVYSEFGYEIIEKHPQNKPIPTATSNIIAQIIGKENIPIHSIRLNGYVGVHELIATDGIERITICHESLSREAFANGALTAAKFIIGRKGLYFMKDVISQLESEVSNDE